jgi:tryptophan-rich sensory protein
MSLKTFLDSEGFVKDSPSQDGMAPINLVIIKTPIIRPEDPDVTAEKLYMKNLVKETLELNDGEPNYFRMVTSVKFLFRLILVLTATIIIGVIIINNSVSNDPDTWYNLLYKPDWAPDGIIITAITGFLAFVFAWIWYTTSLYTSGFMGLVIDVLFIIAYVFVFLWAYFFFQKNKLETARIFSYFIVGMFGLLFIIIAFKMRLFSQSVLLLLSLAWWITIMFYTMYSKELTKEYSILGNVAEDMNNSLYRQKLKLELMNGIKITADGQKIEFNPDDQE